MQCLTSTLAQVLSRCSSFRHPTIHMLRASCGQSPLHKPMEGTSGYFLADLLNTTRQCLVKGSSEVLCTAGLPGPILRREPSFRSQGYPCLGMGTEEFTCCEMPGITDVYIFSGVLEVLFSKSSRLLDGCLYFSGDRQWSSASFFPVFSIKSLFSQEAASLATWPVSFAVTLWP